MQRSLLSSCLFLLVASCGLLRPKPPDYPFQEQKDGLVVHDLLVPAEGPSVRMGDLLTLEYTIELADGGEVVDSSAERGRPFVFTLEPGAVFPGLERGLLGMRLRGSREILVPAALGYGEQGLPPRVPPGADLRVMVELLELER